jgi:hypothetical protein
MVVFAALLVGSFSLAVSNPLPPNAVSEYSTSPPWIEMLCMPYPDTVLPSFVIHTMSGDAVVDSGIAVPQNGIVVFDSSNTSGFALNPEGDSIIIDELFISIEYGCMGYCSVPPLPQESAAWSHWHNACLNFCETPSPGDWGEAIAPDWGNTQVVINEVSASCSWIGGGRFIELFNRSQAAIDIGGWQIICNARYYIPLGTLIPARGHYVLDEDLFPAAFGLSPDCDNVYLLKANGMLVDQTGWSTHHGGDVAFARFPNGGPDTMNFDQYSGFNDESSIGFSSGFPTRRAANRTVTPGFKVIGIHADTLGGRANIYWTNPFWQPTFSQAILRRSLTAFPQTPFDGELLFEGREQEYLFDLVPSGFTAYYTVFGRDSCGQYSIPDSESQIIVHMPMVGVESDEILPQSAWVLKCYPNPFNATTVIEYSIGVSGDVDLSVYNITGQKVVTLVDGEISAGPNRVAWDASGMPSGVYFARLSANDQDRAVILTVLK